MDYFGLKNLDEMPKPKDFRDPDNEIGEQAPIDESVAAAPVAEMLADASPSSPTASEDAIVATIDTETEIISEEEILREDIKNIENLDTETEEDLGEIEDASSDNTEE